MADTPTVMLLAFVDTETLGTAPDAPVAEVCVVTAAHDLAANRLIVDPTYQEFVWLTASEWAKADPVALRINRLYERHPQLTDEYSKAFPPSLDVARQVGRRLAHREIVAAGPEFDAGHLDVFLRSCGVPPAWDYHLRDIRSLVAGYLAGRADALSPVVAYAAEKIPKLRAAAAGPWKVNVLYAALEEAAGQKIQPPPGDEHTAEGDTLAVVRAYAAIHGAEIWSAADG